MSKKTLYQHFDNKADIVMQVSLMQCIKEEEEIEAACEGAENAVDEMMRVMQWIARHVTNMAPNLIPELRKYYPDAWAIHESHNDQQLLDTLIKNIRWGVKDGLYRAELDPEMTARVRIAIIEAGFNDQIFTPSQNSIIKVQRLLLEIFLYGITTLEGRKLIPTYFKAYRLI